MDPLALFVALFRASTLSIGGMSALPMLRGDLVASGVITDRQLVEALTIGRLGTGPGGLYMVSLGYFAMGWLGAAMALVAVTVPPLVIVPAAALLRRQLLSAWLAGLVRGLTMATSGLVLSTTVFLVLPSPSNEGATAWWQVVLIAVGTAIGIEGKRHPVIAVGIGAAAGLLLAR